MTKEELLNKASKLAEVSARGTDAYRDMLEFFDSNVCIPKGENRHLYADVWHEALENALVLQYWDEPDQKWTDYNLSNIDFKWRIKPSEQNSIQSYDDRISTETWFKASDYCKEHKLLPFNSKSWNKAVKAVSKPSEPIYEWQYCHDNCVGKNIVADKYYTDYEYETMVDDKERCIKLPWTKRERT